MSGQQKQSAGAFDIRNVIAALIGFYGVVLVVIGLVGDTAAEHEKTGGVDANLWAGIVMVAVAVAFAFWSRLRPVVVEAAEDTAEGAADDTAEEPARR
jgi:hypothetical protein